MAFIMIFIVIKIILCDMKRTFNKCASLDFILPTFPDVIFHPADSCISDSAL